EGRWMAAVLAAGDGAALGLAAAAWLWEARRGRTMLVDVVTPRRCRLQGPIRTHHSRTLTSADITRRHGIRVTTVARTLVDLTDVFTPFQLANVIHEADFRNRFNEERTREAMARADGRAKLAVLDRAIALYRGGSAGTR